MHDNMNTVDIRTLMKKLTLSILFLVASLSSMQGQAVTEIVTDFNGFWRSAAGNINTVKPNNSHNLLAFSFNGFRFSTGANDAALSAQGLTFMSCDFRALPLHHISGNVTSNTKVALGALYDGVANGPSNPRPSSSIPQYLTDGIKGLDLGTGVANLPSGSVTFSVTNLNINSIGDGAPDILITQIADPTGSTDTYEFVDANGVRVGNSVSVVLHNIPAVGNWTADFYEASTNPMTLALNFTHTDRPLRLWASDFSAFGINYSNISRVTGFRVTTAGNSDIAFVAYNYNTVNVTLPSFDLNFNASRISEQVKLTWNIENLLEVDEVTVEKSRDGVRFEEISTIAARIGTISYSYTDRTPGETALYYRLKLKKQGRTTEYSKVIKVAAQQRSQGAIQMFPNPASAQLTIRHTIAGTTDKILLRNSAGVVVAAIQPAAGSEMTRISVSQYQNGTYYVCYKDTTGIKTSTLQINK